jgi:putative peptide zinc metalloprotease protein
MSFELVDRLDGETSVGQLWEWAIAARDQDAPTQDEWIGLLAELHAAELIVVDRRVAEEKLFDQRKRHQKSERRQRYLNPLYLRFALHNPDPWLDHCLPLARRLFSRIAAVVWLALIAVACISMITHGKQLWAELTNSSILNTRNLLLFFLIYPVLKLAHELAHALAIKRAGGVVNETGIALMVLMPLPYVDASASALFADKYDRMLVSAAGIIVELACAAFGVLLWANTQGTLQDVGLVLFMIGSISTLLLNGNPLLKFDGYYLLADWIEIPNLAARSRRRVISSLRSLVTGRSEPRHRHEDPAECVWLHTYGVLSASYRTLLLLSIAWMLSDQWLFIGVILALIALLMAVGLPLWRMLSALVTDPIYRTRRPLLLLGTIPLVLIAITVWLPLPHSRVVPGVIWVPDEAVLRVSSDCDVVDLFVQPGSVVNSGDRLFTCEDHVAKAKLKELVARVDELQVRRAGAAARDPLTLDTLEAELRASKIAMQDTLERIEENTITASLDGLFEVVDTSALRGRSFSRGDIAGYVVPPAQRTVRLAIDERWISRFDNDLETVALRVTAADGHANVYETTVLRRTPKATRVVASAALSSYGGGRYAADENGDGRLLKEAVFDVELAWPETAEFAAVGSHVGVRLKYSNTPLSIRFGTTLRQAFADRVES